MATGHGPGPRNRGRDEVHGTERPQLANARSAPPVNFRFPYAGPENTLIPPRRSDSNGSMARAFPHDQHLPLGRPWMGENRRK